MACVPGRDSLPGGSGRGEVKDAAGVEKEFRPRCARLQEMVEDVKEVPPDPPTPVPPLSMNVSSFPDSPSNPQMPRLFGEWLARD